MTKKRITSIIAISVGIILLFLILKPKHVMYSVESVDVKKGKIVQEITASGTLQALNTIAVGTQISGIVAGLYVDFNDHVKKGQVIAEIDKIVLQASLMDAQATVMRNEVMVDKTRREWVRDSTLLKENSISQVESDVAWFDYQTAVGNLKSSIAQLKKAQINLNYATIISPVDGVILSRNIDKGQTVAASFNTPTLFSIAQDLTKMRVLTDIDEADIGQVIEGQDAVFTVDAYPNMQFHGKVQQVRLQPTTTQDVVTYTVVIEVPNKDFKLMPGMTANVSIIVKQKDSVLNIAQSALRYTPDDMIRKIKMPKFRIIKKEENVKSGSHVLYEGSHTEVWKIKGDSVIPVLVTIGINDGNNFEISGDFSEGDKLVTEVKITSNAPAPQPGKNPFMPQFPKKK
jgi:HlyD family secretion protein